MNESKFYIELGEGKDLTIPKEVFERMKVQVETKDGKVIDCDIDTSGISKPKGEKE